MPHRFNPSGGRILQLVTHNDVNNMQINQVHTPSSLNQDQLFKYLANNRVNSGNYGNKLAQKCGIVVFNVPLDTL